MHNISLQYAENVHFFVFQMMAESFSPPKQSRIYCNDNTNMYLGEEQRRKDTLELDFLTDLYLVYDWLN